MGVRFRGKINSIGRIQYQVDICDATYSSSVTNINLIEPGFELEYHQKGDQKFVEIKAASCEIYCENATSAFDTFISDLIGAAEKRFQIAIYKDSNLFWIGNILTDLIEDSDEVKPRPFTIKATDALKTLEFVPFDNAGTLYSGREDFIGILLKIIAKLGTGSFWATDDYILKTCVHWYDTQHDAVSAANDPLLYTDIDHDTFKYIDDTETTVAWNSWQVLKWISAKFGCRFLLDNGIFKIYQPVTMKDNTKNWRGYKKNKTQTTYLNVDSRVTPEIISGGLWEYYQQVYQIQTKYIYNQGNTRSLLPISSDNYATQETIGSIQGGINETLIFYGTIVWALASIAQEPRFRVRFDIKLQVGSVYLTNKSGLLEWSATSTDRVYIYSQFSDMQLNFVKYLKTNFVTPPIPADGNCVFSMAIGGYFDKTGAAHTLAGSSAVTFDAIGFKLDLSIDGDIIQAGEKLHIATNTSDGSTAVDSTTIFELPNEKMGDGPYTYTTSRLKTYGSSAWANSSNWSRDKTGDQFDINDLLVREWLALYKNATDNYNGGFFGTTIIASSILLRDSKKYILNAAKFNPAFDQWDGEWFELDFDLTNIVLEDIKHIITKKPFDIIGTDPNDDRIRNDLLDDFLKTDGLTITTLTAVADGAAVTSLTVSAITGIVFLKGMLATVMNPFNGTLVEITINADQAASATSLTITAATFNEMPIGSYIIIKGEKAGELITKNNVSNKPATSHITDATLTAFDSTKWHLIDTSGGTVTLTLPAAANVSGNTYEITAVDVSDAATIDGNGSETINGSTTYVFSVNYETIIIRSDGSNWIIVN